MKRKHYLLELFNGVEDRFLVEAVESQAPARPVLRKNRMVLIAAAAALTALLVGCAAVYFWMQDLSIGTDTYTKTHDEQGKALETPVEVQRQVVTFAGYKDSNSNKASSEWFAFRESYDPEGKYMTNDPDLPDIPNNYEYVYSCYTRELADKLDEIVGKYQMKLLEEWVPIQRWQSDVALQQGLGGASLLKPGAEAAMEPVQGMLYPPYNFSLGFDFRLTGADAAWTERVWVDAYHYHKDYLPPYGAWHLDLDSFEQWNYTTSDGVKLLLAMNNKGSGFIICERENVFQTVAISGNNTGSAYPEPDQVPGKKALEQMAEMFDFGITLDAIDAKALQPAMDAAEEKYQAENAYVAPVYEGFEDYIREQCFWWADNMVYVCHDLNGDGQEELLLGSPRDDLIQLNRTLTMKNGEVVEGLWDGVLCEGNITMHHFRQEHSSMESWDFWKREFTFGEEEDSTFEGCVQRNTDGTWQMGFQPTTLWDEVPATTQAEAEAFLARFTPMELDWQPIANYQLSDGSTLGDYLNSLDKPLSKEELRTFYAKNFGEKENEFRTHYRLMDVNGDGMEEILISGDGKTYWEIFSCRYGQVQNLGTFDALLCENGVFQTTSTRHEYPGIEIQEYEFFTWDGWDMVSLDYVCYNRSTASWQSDLDGTTISEAEAQAILAKYPLLEDQGMLPIGNLSGK